MKEDLIRIAEIQDELEILKNQQRQLENELDMLMMRTGGFADVLNQLNPTVRKSLERDGVTTDIQLVNFIEGNWDTYIRNYSKCTTPEERLCKLKGVGPKKAKEAMMIIGHLL